LLLDGATPLYMATFTDKNPVIQVLCDAKANVNMAQTGSVMMLDS